MAHISQAFITGLRGRGGLKLCRRLGKAFTEHLTVSLSLPAAYDQRIPDILSVAPPGTLYYIYHIISCYLLFAILPFVICHTVRLLVVPVWLDRVRRVHWIE